MATRKLAKRAEFLRDDEVRYELQIRQLWRSSDAKPRRRSKLQKAFDGEATASDSSIATAPSPLPIHEDLKQITRLYEDLAALVRDQFNVQYIRFIEASTAHLLERVGRLPQDNEQVRLFTGLLCTLEARVFEFFDQCSGLEKDMIDRSVGFEVDNDVITQKEATIEGDELNTDARESPNVVMNPRRMIELTSRLRNTTRMSRDNTLNNQPIVNGPPTNMSNGINNQAIGNNHSSNLVDIGREPLNAQRYNFQYRPVANHEPNPQRQETGHLIFPNDPSYNQRPHSTANRSIVDVNDPILPEHNANGTANEDVSRLNHENRREQTNRTSSPRQDVRPNYGRIPTMQGGNGHQRPRQQQANLHNNAWARPLIQDEEINFDSSQYWRDDSDASPNPNAHFIHEFGQHLIDRDGFNNSPRRNVNTDEQPVRANPIRYVPPNEPVDANRHDNSLRDNNKNHNYYTPNTSILKWNIAFSGRENDSKASELEPFLRKVADFCESEKITEAEILTRITHLLRGPAYDWYSHAYQYIHSWEEFQKEIRKRFSSTASVDAVWALIFSKKQKPGENTLNFVDQFVNLMNRLPEPLPPKKRVKFILKGIKPEIARMARTAVIQDVRSLIHYISINYGVRDKMSERVNRYEANNEKPHSRQVSSVHFSDDSFDSDSDESQSGQELSILEIRRNENRNVHSTKTENTKVVKERAKNSKDHMSKPGVVKSGKATVLSVTKKNESTKQQTNTDPTSSDCSVDMNKNTKSSHVSAVATNPPPASRYSKQNISAAFVCYFCKQTHAAGECTVPKEQRPIYCFLCGALGRIYKQCDCRFGRRSETTSQNNNNSNSRGNTKLNDQQVSVIEQTPIEQVESVGNENDIHIDSLIQFPERDLRPHATVKIEGIRFYGLVDSGAQCCVLSKDMVEKHSAWKEKMHPISKNIVTADNRRHAAIGEIELVYKFNGQTHSLKPIVVDLPMKRPIFGIDFQNKFGITMIVSEINAIEVEDEPEKEEVEKHELNDEQKLRLQKAIDLLPKVSEAGILNCTSKIEHVIDTGDSAPIYQRPYVISPKLQKQTSVEIKKMLERGIIRPIEETSWLNPIVVVPKKDNSVRVCLDARKLNVRTKRNVATVLNIDRIFARIKPNCKFFVLVDLTAAFHQIRLRISDQEKTSFAVHGLGSFAYDRMPMGLVNSAATLLTLCQKHFNMETEDLGIFNYVDDFVLCAQSFDEMISQIEILAECLNRAELAISVNKSIFGLKRVRFLGHVIDEDGIHMDKSRFEAIEKYKRPRNVSEVRSLIGIAAWYKKFIDGFSDLTAPLTELLKKNVHFVWTAKHDRAFQKIKLAVATAPVLAFPDYDKPFFLEARASDIGISAILSQEVDGDKRVIAFMSSKFSVAQKLYHITERNCLAVILALEKYRMFVGDRIVYVQTCHHSLNWLRNANDQTGRITRWSLRLAAFNIVLKSKQTQRRNPVDLLLKQLDDDEEQPEQHIETPNSQNDTNVIDKGKAVNIEIAMISVEDTQVIETLSEHKDIPVAIVEMTSSDQSIDTWYKENYEKCLLEENSEMFKVEKGNLYFRCDRSTSIIEHPWKICVPKEDQATVLMEQHDEAYHPGFMRTYRRTLEIYYWPKMGKYIKEYVDKCEICRTTKAKNVNAKAPIGSIRSANVAFRIISIDFIGPMIRSTKGNTWLFVIADYFSGFIILKALPSAKAPGVVKFIRDHVFATFGVCEKCICDNATVFRSAQFVNFMRSHQAELEFIPNYYPSANPCERANRTIISAIRSFVVQQTTQRKWDDELYRIQMMLNSHVNLTNNISPHYALFGRRIALKGTDFSMIDDANPLVDEVDDRNYVLNQEIRHHIALVRSKNREYYNRNAKTRKFNVGDYVYLRNFKLSSAPNEYMAKLGRKYIKVVIMAKLGSDTYTVATVNGHILGNYHANHMFAK